MKWGYVELISITTGDKYRQYNGRATMTRTDYSAEMCRFPLKIFALTGRCSFTFVGNYKNLNRISLSFQTDHAQSHYIFKISTALKCDCCGDDFSIC